MAGTSYHGTACGTRSMPHWRQRRARRLVGQSLPRCMHWHDKPAVLNRLFWIGHTSLLCPLSPLFLPSPARPDSPSLHLAPPLLLNCPQIRPFEVGKHGGSICAILGRHSSFFTLLCHCISYIFAYLGCVRVCVRCCLLSQWEFMLIGRINITLVLIMF